MTEEEWEATEQGRAAESFIKTNIGLGVVLAAAKVGSILTDQFRPVAVWLMNNSGSLGLPPEVVEPLRAVQKYLDLLDPELDQAVRSSLIVIGACSGIEAYVERFTKNRIREQPSILDGTAFDAGAIAQNKSLTADEILERQWRAIKASPGKKPRQHDRFEIALKVAGRAGQTAPVIEQNVNTAYVVRNVWSHNAGYADATFLSKAPPELTFQPGDLVRLTQEDGQRYLSVIMTYGMIVANRERKVHGLGPIPMGGNPVDSEWGIAYNEMYTA
jgi:hypothetical protein